MRLGEMLNQFINQNSVFVKSADSVQTQQLPNNIAAQIKALVPGQILQGEVLENVGDTVKLLVNVNGEMVPLQAKLEQSIMLALGKSLLFQVKNNGSTLSLSPLFENMGMEQNAAKALETASLPVNNATMSMTGTLMQEGMPIDKGSLQQIYQEVLTNQNAELMDIIDLHKLGMPVNEENLKQIQSYKTMTHQITAGVEQLSQDLEQLIQNMAEKGQKEEILNFFKAIWQADTENVLVNQEAVTEQKTVLTEEEILTKLVKESMETSSGNDIVAHMEFKGEQQISVLPELQNMKPEQLLRELIGQLEQTGGEQSTLTKLVNSDVFKAVLNEFLQKELLLPPESIDKDGIKEIYQRLAKQLGAISETLTQMGQEQSPLGKTVQNMSQNINFLNQMNSMYAYVQLPLKLSEGNAHGELYVYSNKKHLASTDGEVSALLHLDMEHLGAVDVHVKLKDSNVSTQFFLEDEEMLDFLYEHMDMLTERLKKRGYNMTCKMTIRGEKDESNAGNNTFQELIRDNSNIPMLVNYSFDVRA